MNYSTLEIFDKTRYFPFLDGARAVCVLLVMFSHIPANVARPRWIYGQFGVDIFFVISGFLITTLLKRELAGAGRVALSAFYLRRFTRIVPVYLLTVLLYFAAVHLPGESSKLAQFKVALPYLLSFMQEYRPPGAGNVMGHSWTLGIEEKFYVVWPVFVMLMHRQRMGTWIWTALLCVLVGASPYVYERSYGGLLLGSVLAAALADSSSRRWVAMLERVPVTLWCVLAAAAYLLAGANDQLVLLFSLSVALLLASLLLRESRLRKVLEARILVFIGRRSYAMYLVHVLVAESISKLIPAVLPPRWPVVVFASYAASLAVASVIYIIVERPLIDLGRRLSRRIVARRESVLRDATPPLVTRMEL